MKKRNKLLEQENEVLRRAAAYFARELPPKMKYPMDGPVLDDSLLLSPSHFR